MNKKEVYLWAKECYMLFLYMTYSAKTVDKAMQDGVRKLGIKKEDCFAYEDLLKEPKCWPSLTEVKACMEGIDDINALCSAAVYRWNNFDKEEKVVKKKKVIWYLRLFWRLLDLTEEDCEYIYCEVQFEENGRNYTYISNSDKVCVGDTVIVPVGNKNEPKAAKVVSVNRYTTKNAPMWPRRIKCIIDQVS